MKRLLMKELENWKESPYRKPLILWGARQVGKTWLMKEFAKQSYQSHVYISFYNNSRMSGVFERDYDIKRIIRDIEAETKVTIIPEDTLLIFDEIQSAPKVLEALKYFCEEAREYNVIAAGSLLGVSIHEGISFPVGKVDELRLYPMDFREFLIASGEDRLAEFLDDYTLPEINDFADKYETLMKQYFCTGGMPEAVQRFIDTSDFDEVRGVQLGILGQYEGDFGKHIKASELPRIRLVWNSIPLQLSKENKKFFFGQIKKGARQKEFELAIQWLCDAGLLHKVYKVSRPGMPLKSYIDFSSFKLFFNDIGLLGAFSELDIRSVLFDDRLYTEFKGAMAEQYVLQQLIASAHVAPYYFSGEKSTYETDFLIQRHGDIVPIEVKSSDNLRSKSLKVFCEKYHPKNAIRTSAAPYRKQEWMENIPLWAVGAI